MTEKIQSDCLVIRTIATPQPCKDVTKTPGDISTGANCEPTFHRLSLPNSLTQLAFSICLALLDILGGLPISHADAGGYVRSYGGTQAEGQVGARQWKQFEIEVEDDFAVDGSTMRVDLNLYAWNVNAIDLRLITPDGSRWRFLNNRCDRIALALGHRGFAEITTGDPGFITVGSETADWYGFSDLSTHAALGTYNDGGYCLDVHNNPDSGNPGHNSSLPRIHSNRGSWTKLPPNTYSGHPNSSFDARFSGKQSKGT